MIEHEGRVVAFGRTTMRLAASVQNQYVDGTFSPGPFLLLRQESDLLEVRQIEEKRMRPDLVWLSRTRSNLWPSRRIR